MKLIRDDNSEQFKAIVAEAISQHGWSAEHNAEHFLRGKEEDYIPVFFEIEKGGGMLAYEDSSKGVWDFFNEPIALPEDRCAVVSDVLEHVFSNPSTTKAWIEVRLETALELRARLPSTLRARETVEELTWPILNLSSYDSTLPAPFQKPLRNVRNRFFREHTVEIVPVSVVAPALLRDLVRSWRKKRRAKDRAYAGWYNALIDGNFLGTENALVFLIDGVPEGMSAGWKIPNTNGFYLELCLHSYKYWGLGEIVMMESIARAKESGHSFIELGGSGGPLLAFKQKFGEVTTYVTHRFSIARR